MYNQRQGWVRKKGICGREEGTQAATKCEICGRVSSDEARRICKKESESRYEEEPASLSPVGHSPCMVVVVCMNVVVTGYDIGH